MHLAYEPNKSNNNKKNVRLLLIGRELYYRTNVTNIGLHGFGHGVGIARYVHICERVIGKIILMLI